jgi:hypothetical protein
MKQISTWEANSHSSSQDIPRLLRNPNVHYRVHESMPLINVVNQCIRSINSHPVSLRCILPFTPRSSEWSLTFVFSDQNKFNQNPLNSFGVQTYTRRDRKPQYLYYYYLFVILSSFIDSTAQRRPWPPPQNPAEFFGGFSTIFFFTG